MSNTFGLTSISESNDLSPNNNNTTLHRKRESNTSSIQPSHTWWDESQLDLDLAEDPILIIPMSKTQKLKQKIKVTMGHHHHHHHQQQPQQRTSWVSSSSTDSSIYSSHSLSTPSFHPHFSSSSSSTRSKISRSFLQLKQLIIKNH